MKVVFVFFLFIEIIEIYSIYFQPLAENTSIKYSDDFYKKHSEENFEDLNIKILEQIKKLTRIKSNSNRLKSNRKNYDGVPKSEGEVESVNMDFVDMIVKEREVKIFISKANECNVLIKDKILYEQHEQNSNFLEHLVINSNYDYINPDDIKSDDIQLDFFAFNRKLNLFSVFYENPKNLTRYSIEYNYMAVNLIKTYKIKNMTDGDDVYNYIIWKFYNENEVNVKQKLRILFYFELDKNFGKESVRFIENYNSNSTMNFEKTIIKNKNSTIPTVLYEWNGLVNPNQVLIINAKFPLYFENCNAVTISVPIIIVGSIFICFLTYVLYIILSQLLWLEN